MRTLSICLVLIVGCAAKPAPKWCKGICIECGRGCVNAPLARGHVPNVNKGDVDPTLVVSLSKNLDECWAERAELNGELDDCRATLNRVMGDCLEWRPNSE